jgi:predicted lysophospholipase L1 biosynthesis ABC-type transport system permease subunit
MHDFRYASPREPFGAVAIAPLGQIPLSTPPTLVLRTGGDTNSVIAALEQRLPAIAPKVRIGRIEAVRDLVQTQACRERLLAWISGAFGGLAVLLAAVGLYGVISYSAECRTQEMGIRLALGARPREIRRLLLRETAFMLLPGVAIGWAATMVSARTLGSLLFDLNPQDPATLAFAVCVVSVAALAASYVPAFRVSRLDPLPSLRAE